MDGAMGQGEDVVEAVLTCEGDFHDPELHDQIERFRHRLKDLLCTDTKQVQVRKVEPWNSVKVTLTIPREAAVRLRQLAQNGSEALRQMGVLSVQVQGDSQIALTFLGSNNERREVVFNASPAPHGPSTSSAAGGPVRQQASSSAHPPAEAVVSLDDLAPSSSSSPGPSSDEVTRKNIVDYLRQGPHLRQNAALIGSLIGAVNAVATTASSSSPRFGMGLDIPTVSNPVSNSLGAKVHSFRPNNIASVSATAVQNQSHQGSHVANNFPFKTTGAFHPPVPRHPASAGQNFAANAPSSSSTSLPQLQQQANSINSPRIQPAAIRQLSSVSVSGPSQHGLAGSSMNSFSPLGALMHPSGPGNSGFNSSSTAMVPSTSSSNYFADLPPPPPYPHGSTSTASPRASKQGNASSPMLVNLLQTDPSVAAAGMASGNPNKPLTTGDSSVSESPPKKKRKKKPKSGAAKSLPNELIGSQGDNQSDSGVSQTGASHGNPVSSEQINMSSDTCGPLDVLNTRLDPSAALGFLRENKASLSQCHPSNDSHKDGPTISGLQSESSISAIGARTKSSVLLESDRQLSQQQTDAFSSEAAAGKIINPYTGQLEPRDLPVDSVHPRLKDPGMPRGTSYSATQMLARRAQELDEIAQKSVPHSSSAMLENIRVTPSVYSPTPNLVSPSTATTAAAASTVLSGKPSQASNVKTLWSNSSPSNVTTMSVKGSLTQSTVYAGPPHAWQNTGDVSSPLNLPSITSSAGPQPMLPRDISRDPAKKTAPYGLLNGPVVSERDMEGQVRVAYSEVSTVPQSSEASSSLSESVIYSSVKVCLHSSTSQATFPQPHSTESHGLRSEITTAPFSSTSSLSLSVSLDIPSAHQRLSSPPVTMSAQARPSLLDHASATRHKQAAATEADSKALTATLNTSPSLLNSVPEKHMDSQSSTESPPETKVLSEGDENSNHSGLVHDSGPEHSGTAALIEHSRVKIENHDSGIGSSSERSDDTPSEPGDGEFRAGNPASEAEVSPSSQKLVDCKPDPPLVSSCNTITVGYMINPSSEGGSHLKSSASLKSAASSKRPPVTSIPSSGAEISQFYDAHCKSMEKQAGLMAVGQVAQSSSWLAEKAGISQHQLHGSKTRENGPLPTSLENRSSPKMNGPTSQGSINTMVMAMNELHPKKARLSPKQAGMNNKVHPQNLRDAVKEEHQGKEGVLERLSRNHQLEDQKESLSSSFSGLQEQRNVESMNEESHNDALSHRLEHHTEQLFLDLEEMQAKMMGNGTTGMAGGGANMEGKGGNITSIYSKRSSPVNVNMLNHIYAPGLPLPRRLTESVQRLVKPLPASEMAVSVSVPQSRAYNKSPVSSSAVGVLPRATGAATLLSTNGPHHPTRMANHSGARSPGASMPRLIPSDQHRLLSGGLDLAGLSNLQVPSAYVTDAVHVGGAGGGISGLVPAFSGSAGRDDFLLKGDPTALSVSLHSPPNLLRDSKPYSSKMLSQSYPPFKSREHLASVVQRNHDIHIDLNASKSNVLLQQTYADHVLEPAPGLLEKGTLQSTRQANSLYSGRSNVESKQSRLPNQHRSEETDINHSNNHSEGVEPHKFSFSSSSSSSTPAPAVVHSNASSPLMPILQRGQEPPITPTLPSSMPSISSQPPLISMATAPAAAEVSPTFLDDAAAPVPGEPPTTVSSSTTQKPVPCSSPAGSANTSSSDVKADFERVKGSVELSSTDSHTPLLPTLSPITSSPLPPLMGQLDSFRSSASGAVAPSHDMPVSGRSSPPKLTRAHNVTCLASVSPKAGAQGYQSNRNIFDSVSAQQLANQQIEFTAVTASTSVSSRSAPVATDCKPHSCDTQIEASDGLPSVPNKVTDHAVEPERKPLTKTVEPQKKSCSENGSKQTPSVAQIDSDVGSSKSLKSRPLPTTSNLPTSSGTSKSVRDSGINMDSEKIKDVKVSPSSSSPRSTSQSTTLSSTTPATIASVASGNSLTPRMPKPGSTSASSSKPVMAKASLGSTSKSQPIATSASSSIFVSASASGSVEQVRATTSLSAGASASAVASSLVSSSGIGGKGGGSEDGTEPSPANAGSPVKEPILETLATALKQHQPTSKSSNPNKTSEKGAAYQRPPMVPLTPSDISKLEQSMVLQGKIMSIQSSPQAKISASGTDAIGGSSIDSGDSVNSHNRVTRKRKSNPSEGDHHDGEGSTAPSGTTPQKQQHLAGSGSSIKTKPAEGPVTKAEKPTVKEDSSVDGGLTPIKTAAASAPPDRNEGPAPTVEQRDTAAKISADLEKSQERRRHRSITSSDDGHSHRSSSNESRDSSSHSHREGRSHRNAALTTPERDVRSHRSSGSSSGEGQQHREARSYSRTSDKDVQSKENRSHRVPSHHSSEDARHTQVDWSQDNSGSNGDDKDKAKTSAGKVIAATTDKILGAESKGDDSQRKGQRVKRQFYAYVPEKSLDQTYFDTPILSGRTRSKNKPEDEKTGSAVTPGPPLTAPAAPSSAADGPVSSVPHQSAASSSTTAGVGQSAGHSRHAGDPGNSAATEANGGKRPTRSVRTKDSSQEQNPTKRRKVQQQR